MVSFGVIQVGWGRKAAFKPKRARNGVSGASKSIIMTVAGERL